MAGEIIRLSNLPAASALDGTEHVVVVQGGTTKRATVSALGGSIAHPNAAAHEALGLITDTDLTAHSAAADPHTGYQKESEKNVANGYAGLTAAGIVTATRLGTGTPDNTKFLRGDNTWQVVSGGSAHPDLSTHDALGLATQAELDSHVGAADPHTGYQKESEKDTANGYAGLSAAGFVLPAKLGSGTPDSTKWLRGDGTWSTISASHPDLAAHDTLGLATQTELDTAIAGRQPLDADLTAIAALVSAADKMPYSTGAQAWALATFTAFGRQLVAATDSSSARAITGASPSKVPRNLRVASYTLIASDADKTVHMNVASANNLTIPANIFVAEQLLEVVQWGTGQTSFVAGSGMTIRSEGGRLKLSGQYASASLYFISATEVLLTGSLTT